MITRDFYLPQATDVISFLLTSSFHRVPFSKSSNTLPQFLYSTFYTFPFNTLPFHTPPYSYSPFYPSLFNLQWDEHTAIVKIQFSITYHVFRYHIKMKQIDSTSEINDYVETCLFNYHLGGGWGWALNFAKYRGSEDGVLSNLQSWRSNLFLSNLNVIFFRVVTTLKSKLL